MCAKISPPYALYSMFLCLWYQVYTPTKHVTLCCSYFIGCCSADFLFCTIYKCVYSTSWILGCIQILFLHEVHYVIAHTHVMKLWMYVCTYALYCKYNLYVFVITFHIFRVLESHYIIWCTLYNHIPMEYDIERFQDWPSLQV